MSRDSTAFIRDHYNSVAGRYDALIQVPERLLFADGRRWGAGQARGNVLEIAVGTGRNLPHYPPDTHVTGIDLSSAMIAIARSRADQAGFPVDLHVADAQDLPFPDESFDTVVATLALCSIPDDTAAAAEIARVLRPGGTLVLLEHVRSPSPVVRAVQRLLQPLLLRLEGDHLLREPDKRVEASGLDCELLERSRGLSMLTSPPGRRNWAATTVPKRSGWRIGCFL
jgi:ubiquinone/menaquinone biosynthesis C-methylase UbiE